MIAGLPHHRFVVALQTDQPQPVIRPIHEALNNFATIGSTIDVVAQSYNRRDLSPRMLENSIEGRVQQVDAAMKIGNGISHGHFEPIA